MTAVLARYRGKRHAVQVAALALLVLIPATGVLRIDFATASLLLLGRKVGLSDFAVVCGLALLVASAPLLTYNTIGTVWCGWACPQNTLAEWADRLTHRLLGRRASVRVEDAGLQVAPSKNRLANWALLVAAVLAASLLLGLIPLFYFSPPGDVWALLTFRADPQFEGFMLRLYAFFALAVVVDVAVMRFFWCDYLCLYRFGQLLFRNEGLQVHYDAARAAACEKCRLCATVCVTRIEPTRIGRADRCIDCAECIDACNTLQGRRGEPGLLRFDSGVPPGTRPGAAALILRWVSRMGIPGLVTAAGLLLTAWGLFR